MVGGDERSGHGAVRECYSLAYSCSRKAFPFTASSCIGRLYLHYFIIARGLPADKKKPIDKCQGTVEFSWNVKKNSRETAMPPS
jgi:hypothetical protein